MTQDELIARVRWLVIGLAEQQAMPDDWWRKPLDEVLAALAKDPEKS